MVTMAGMPISYETRHGISALLGSVMLHGGMIVAISIAAFTQTTQAPQMPPLATIMMVSMVPESALQTTAAPMPSPTISAVNFVRQQPAALPSANPVQPRIKPKPQRFPVPNSAVPSRKAAPPPRAVVSPQQPPQAMPALTDHSAAASTLAAESAMPASGAANGVSAAAPVASAFLPPAHSLFMMRPI
jgi:hypothetical protein